MQKFAYLHRQGRFVGRHKKQHSAGFWGAVAGVGIATPAQRYHDCAVYAESKKDKVPMGVENSTKPVPFGC